MTDTPSRPKFDSIHDARIGDRLIRYGLARNVPAMREGRDCHIAMAYIEHENGRQQVVAIDEELIKFMGPQCIEQEIARAIR